MKKKSVEIIVVHSDWKKIQVDGKVYKEGEFTIEWLEDFSIKITITKPN